jgi:RNA polymerase sigma-70 factor, ECF subfamily
VETNGPPSARGKGENALVRFLHGSVLRREASPAAAVAVREWTREPAARRLDAPASTMWDSTKRLERTVSRSDPDMALVQAVRDGDHRAYSELIGRYQDKIFSLVAGLVRDHDDALDLTQEIFVKAYRGLDKFRAQSGFYTWLYRIAVRHCIDFSRRRKRNQDTLPLDGDVLTEMGFEPADTSIHANPERVVVNEHLKVAIRDAIASIQEPFRTAVVLHDVEGLSQEEIAQIMGCPLGTAKSRIQRGRTHLRERLRGFVEARD